jgi:hypothetical protein
MSITKETRDENGKLHSFNDEPAIVYYNGGMYWYQHGKRHRDNDLPAIICSNGTMYWYRHGNVHREKNAALIYHNGHKEYWLNGKEYTFDEWIKLTPIPEEDKLQLILEK